MNACSKERHWRPRTDGDSPDSISGRRLNADSVGLDPLCFFLFRPFLLLRPSSGARSGAKRPLAASLKTALACLLSTALALLLNACDGGGAPPGPSEDPITPEIRTAIESGDLAALSVSDLPDLPGVDELIIDSELVVVLGKAFFWEMYAGDNGQACASCHFHAGTDRRIQNTLHPGGKDEAFFEDETGAVEHPLFVFDPVRSGDAGGPNYILNEHDFPFHDKADPADRDSPIAFDTDDVVGSQGS